MKKLLIAANWKSNKTKFEAKEWIEEIAYQEFPENLEVIIFPPFTLLDIISGYVRVNSLPFKIGAQDVSAFGNGAYTGEVSAEQIKEFADFVLIGHSERRNNNHEDQEMINNKLIKSKEAGLKTILCISGVDQMRDLSTTESIIAFEPIGSIGTGAAESPVQVSKITDDIKKLSKGNILYGGSVSADNINEYTTLEDISGVLIGSASLDPINFLNILKNVC